MRFLIAATLAVFLCAPAFAQVTPVPWVMSCAERGFIRDFLENRFGETPVAQSMAGQGVVQMWENRDSGTWTLVLLMPSGTHCVVISGELGWEALPDDEEEPIWN